MTISNTDTPEILAPTTRRTRPGLTWWQAAAAGAGIATAVNLVVLLVARAADASLVLREPGADHAITVGGVIFSSAVPMVGGILLATALALLWPGFLRVAQFVGGGFGLLSAAGPVLSDTDAGTRVALATMHMVVAVVVVLALEAIRRRRSARV